MTQFDYALISKEDSDECNKLWDAAKSLGFWYLKNHEMDQEVDSMFDINDKVMDAPLEDKMKFSKGMVDGMYLGYKPVGVLAVDAQANSDAMQIMSVAHDDIGSYPKEVWRTYPSTVTEAIPNDLRSFADEARKILVQKLPIFEEKLGLPKNTLASLHPPIEKGVRASQAAAHLIRYTAGHRKLTLLEYTDYSSLLFNRLGGLQVKVPGSTEWQD
ncbi:hypothetical protein B0H14DRAFT_3527771 [Mycena olivaceomarginata]|nr:hypothetical protein B0H14DRAFT_3527771 [Mycena olivaceomarginata]